MGLNAGGHRQPPEVTIGEAAASLSRGSEEHGEKAEGVPVKDCVLAYVEDQTMVPMRRETFPSGRFRSYPIRQSRRQGVRARPTIRALVADPSQLWRRSGPGRPHSEDHTHFSRGATVTLGSSHYRQH